MYIRKGTITMATRSHLLNLTLISVFEFEFFLLLTDINRNVFGDFANVLIRSLLFVLLSDGILL